MSLFLENLIYFAGAFVVILLVYILFINRKNKKKKENNLSNIEQAYLIKKFKLTKTSEKTLMWVTSLTNSFIISFSSVVVFNVDKWIWKILSGFVLLVILIYSLYEIEGKILKRIEDRK